LGCEGDQFASSGKINRTRDLTGEFVQPLLAPMFQTRAPAEAQPDVPLFSPSIRCGFAVLHVSFDKWFGTHGEDRERGQPAVKKEDPTDKSYEFLWPQLREK
jgi:hypothetical protein